MATDNNYYKIKGDVWKQILGFFKSVFWKVADTVNVALGDAAFMGVDNSVTKSSNNAVKSGGVYDAVHPAVVNHGTSDTTFALTPNVFHIWGEVASLTLTLATPSDNTIENEYKFRFESGSTATTISLPSSVVYDESKGDLIPEADKIYEVSIEDNIAVWISIDNS